MGAKTFSFSGVAGTLVRAYYAAYYAPALSWMKSLRTVPPACGETDQPVRIDTGRSARRGTSPPARMGMSPPFRAAVAAACASAASTRAAVVEPHAKRVLPSTRHCDRPCVLPHSLLVIAHHGLTGDAGDSQRGHACRVRLLQLPDDRPESVLPPSAQSPRAWREDPWRFSRRERGGPSARWHVWSSRAPSSPSVNLPD